MRCDVSTMCSLHEHRQLKTSRGRAAINRRGEFYIIDTDKNQIVELG
jgi:hypothetical protein